jgi:anaerobic selenocysteine-containing dehydrogenase
MPGNTFVMNNYREWYVGDSEVDLVIALLERLGHRGHRPADQNPEPSASLADDHIKKTYKVEDIFTDIAGDPDNVLMTFPPEIIKYLGLKEGDTVDVTTEGNSLKIAKVDDASG